MKGPTIRTIARLANVCPMTVSLALRNHNKISLATRVRIQRLAEKVGYRPDPTVVKLMHHLRTERRDRPSTAVAVVAAPGAVTYSETVLQGVRASAERQGYAADVFRVRRAEKDRRALRRALRNRSIEGVVICPQVPSDVFADLLEWEQFSVVATSFTWNHPLFTRVVPDGFGNTLLACGQLAAAGFRRLGLVETREIEEIVRHHFSAAVNWHGTYRGAGLIPALQFEAPDGPADLLVDWFDQHRPDVIVAADPRLTRCCHSILEHAGRPVPATVCLSDEDDPTRPCILQHPEQVGRAAMELLAGMLQRGDRGIPPHPVTVQVPGEWRSGHLLAPDRT